MVVVVNVYGGRRLLFLVVVVEVDVEVIGLRIH